MTSRVIAVFVCVTLWTALAQRPAARPNVSKGKNRTSTMLRLKSPNQSGVTVLLSHPFHPPGNPWELTWYQLVTVRSATGHEEVVEDLRGTEEAFAAPEDPQGWSPDGDYLAIIKGENLLTRPIQSLKFLELRKHEFVHFATSTGDLVSASNFNGWYEDKRHSARVITTSKSHRYVEALPK